jgi:LmbE family N-acetylglucosaminyl deacetylase
MPTLMAVHAHPDDEATSTGGVLARYADEGFTTIVVTCTNGELGDLPGGVKPDTEGHDEEEVVRLRMQELKEACAILNVTHLELLGYRDSGMADWEHKGHADAFCNVPVDAAADKLVALFDTYKPDVVVTYDPDSGYNHPDHIQASRVTMAAVERTGVPKKFYFTGQRTNRWARIRELLEEAGVELPPRPEPDAEMIKRMEALAAKVTTSVDVTAYAQRKMDALRVHVSQVGEMHWSSRLPPEAMTELWSEEHFVRVKDDTGAHVPEDDLFAGLR